MSHNVLCIEVEDICLLRMTILEFCAPWIRSKSRTMELSMWISIVVRIRYSKHGNYEYILIFKLHRPRNLAPMTFKAEPPSEHIVVS